MAETAFLQQTVLELDLDKSSMGRVAKGISDSVSKAFKDFKIGGQIGSIQAKGMGMATEAGAAMSGKKATAGGGMGAFGKMGFGKILAALAPIAIVASILGEMMQFITPIFKFIAYVFISLFAPVLRLLFTALSKAGTLKPEEIQGDNFLETMGNVLTNPIAALRKVSLNFQEIGRNIRKAVLEIAEALSNVGVWLYDTFTETIGLALTVLNEVGQWIFDTVVGAIELGLDVIKGLGEAFSLALQGKFPEAFEKVKEVGKKILDFVTKRIKAGKEVIESIGQKVVDFIMERVEAGPDVLKDLGQGIVDWIMGAIELGVSALSSIGQMIADWIGGALGIGSDNTPATGGGVIEVVTEAATTAGKAIMDALGIGVERDETPSGTPENDFISRPGMGIQSFSPQDNIIGVKNLSSLLGGGGGGFTYAPVINVSAGVDKQEFERILDRQRDIMRREQQGRMSYVTNIKS